MIIKKAMTLTSLLIGILIVIGIFTGGYIYLESSVSSVGGSIDDARYNKSVGELNETRTSLDTNIQAIKTNYKAIGEAESAFLAAWNGMKGIGNTLKLPISFFDTGLETYEIILGVVDIIPIWVKILIGIGIGAALVLLAIAVLTNNPKL